MKKSLAVIVTVVIALSALFVTGLNSFAGKESDIYADGYEIVIKQDYADKDGVSYKIIDDDGVITEIQENETRHLRCCMTVITENTVVINSEELEPQYSERYGYSYCKVIFDLPQQDRAEETTEATTEEVTEETTVPEETEESEPVSVEDVDETTEPDIIVVPETETMVVPETVPDVIVVPETTAVPKTTKEIPVVEPETEVRPETTAEPETAAEATTQPVTVEEEEVTKPAAETTTAKSVTLPSVSVSVPSVSISVNKATTKATEKTTAKTVITEAVSVESANVDEPIPYTGSARNWVAIGALIALLISVLVAGYEYCKKHE